MYLQAVVGRKSLISPWFGNEIFSLANVEVVV